MSDDSASENESLRKLAKIQAHCRSMHVRSELSKVKALYEEIFSEIEGNDSDTCIVWPNLSSASSSHSLLSPDGSLLSPSVNASNGGHQSSICYPKFVLRKNLGRSSAAATSPSVKEKAETPKAINQTYCIKKSEHQEQAAASGGGNKENCAGSLGIDSARMNFLESGNLKTLSKDQLIEAREGVALELLWIEQAIQSRRHYLKLKENLKSKQ